MKKLFFTPFTEEVEEFLFKHINEQIESNPNYKCLHITPTMFLYHRRDREYIYKYKKLGNKHRKDYTERYHRHIDLNQFDRWVRNFVYKVHNENPLSKSESHVLIKRSVARFFPGRTDWNSVTGRLLELFLYFNTTKLSVEEMEKLSPYRDWQEIMLIFRDYLHQLEEFQLEDYSQALVRLIETSPLLEEYDEVFFDGPFLFFEPVHERLIERMERSGKSIYFIVPFDDDNGRVNPAYRVIQKVYSRYVPVNKWERISWLHHGDSTFLDKLPSVIFTDQTAQFYGSSFQIQSYSTPEQELQSVVEQIAQSIKNGDIRRNDVLLVTPNPMKLRPLIRELSEQAGLTVDVPERPLLGLTSGEFIQLIYRIRIDERKLDQPSYFDANIFKKILQSNWFKDGPESLPAFERVEEAFFSNRNTIEQWREQLICLILVKKGLEEENGLSYHPLSSVRLDEIKLWLSIIEDIIRIQDAVFQAGSGPIQMHAEVLKNVLVDLAQRNGVYDSQDVAETLERVNEVVAGIHSQNRIPMRTEEFASVLHQLFVEQEEENELENIEWVQQHPIVVTGPENIAYLRYERIYIVHFTQENFPRLECPEWPLTLDILWRLLTKTTRLDLPTLKDLEKLLVDREQYYFYLTLMTPKTFLNISFPRLKEGIQVFPSHYLYDLAKALGIEELNQLEDSSPGRKEDIIELLKRANILKEIHYINQSYNWFEHPGESYCNYSPGSSYDLYELALYQLCPRRFYYAKQFPEKHVYSSVFQLVRYIAAEIYKKAAVGLFSDHKNQTFTEVLDHMPAKARFLKEIPKYIQQAVTNIRSLFPVEERIMETAEYYARLFLESLIDRIFNKNWFQQLLGEGTVQIKMEFDLPYKTMEVCVKTNAGSYHVRAVRELSVFYWNKEVTYSISHSPHFLNISSYDPLNDDEEESFAKWFWRLNREIFYESEQEKVIAELTVILDGIERREFPKKSGHHCFFCPFRKSCQEAEIGINVPSLREESA